VSKWKDLEQQLARTEQQLRLFQKISRLMVSEATLQQVLNSIVGLIKDFTNCDSCIVYLVEGTRLVLCASNNAPSSALGQVSLNLNEGLTGWVARERRLLAISREAYNDPRFKTFAELEADTFEAFLSAPVIARSRVVGVINVQHREPRAYTGDEMELLTTIGEQVGCLLLLARLSKDTLEQTVSLESVLSGSLAAARS
jgi:signal transduction protein with GAF and PtsI domain